MFDFIFVSCFFSIFKLSLLSPPPSFVWCRLPLAPSGWCFLVCCSFRWCCLPRPPPLGGAVFRSSPVGVPFLFVSCLFCVFLSTKCLTTSEEGRKQHYFKEEEEAGGTTQKKGGEGSTTQEGQTAPHQRRRRGNQHQPREGRRRQQHPRRERDKVKWWSTLRLLGGGAGCPSWVGLPSPPSFCVVRVDFVICHLLRLSPSRKSRICRRLRL